MPVTKDQLKGYAAVLTGLAGLATAIGSCNTAAQERLQADNKIYSVLADSITKQGADITALHKELDELRGYLQAMRNAPPPSSAVVAPAAGVAPGTRRLVPLSLPALPSASASALPPELPPPAPRAVLRPLPTFGEL